MKRFLKTFCRELLCLLCLLILSIVMYLWKRYDGVKNPEIGSVLFLLAAIDAFVLVRTFRALWRKKMRKKVVFAFQRMFEKMIGGLTRTFEKWGIGKRKANVIGGRASILFDRLSSEKEMKQPTLRKTKWKHLQTARERMGYLYAKMIQRRVAEGLEYHSSDTPLQLQRQKENTPIEDALFDLYVQKRYDGRTEPEEELICYLKEELDIK